MSQERNNHRAAICTAVAALGGAAYAVSRLPRMASWGATDEETTAAMPGDEIVGLARYRTTHAVTIDAPADRVWPWLVQMGQGRGGLYSYDWLENLVGLDIHSAEDIEPELQHLAVGDEIRMVPEGTQPDLAFVVARLDPPSLLVLGPRGDRREAMEQGLPYPAWTFLLTSPGPGTSRLVVRFQSDYEPTAVGRLMYDYGLQPVHFLMERRMMLGIKERAERAAVA